MGFSLLFIKDLIMRHMFVEHVLYVGQTTATPTFTYSEYKLRAELTCTGAYMIPAWIGARFFNTITDNTMIISSVRLIP